MTPEVLMPGALASSSAPDFVLGVDTSRKKNLRSVEANRSMLVKAQRGEHEMTCSILVPSHVLSKVQRRLEKLAKKAGVELSLIEGTSTIYETENHQFYTPGLADRMGKGSMLKFWQGLVSETPRAMDCARFTVGDFPKSNGYAFVGKIEHTEGGNILSVAPGERGTELPVEMREAKPTCDHCNAKRSRKETFVIRTPEGALIRIGRNCLADFLKSGPDSIIAAAELAAYFSHNPVESDEEYRGGGGGWGVATFCYLACAVSSVERNGFRKSEEDGATKNDAAFLAGPPPTGDSRAAYLAREDWKAGQPTKEHIELGKKIVEWARDLEAGNSNYLHNLKVALLCGEAAYQRQGLLASAPSAYARAMGDVVKRKVEVSRVDAGYFGEVGARVDLDATVLRIASYDTDFGTKFIVTFVTDEGQELVWKTSSNCPRSGDTGAKFAIRGTIKAHEQYKGRCQTALSRVKWEDPIRGACPHCGAGQHLSGLCEKRCDLERHEKFSRLDAEGRSIGT